MRGHVRKKNKTWSYIFDIGKIDGKRRQKEKSGFKSKSEAQKALREALDEFQNSGSVFKASNISVAEYMDFWLKNYVEVNLKYRTIEIYKNIVKNHINPNFGHYYLKNLNHISLQTFFTSKKKSGLSKNTINNIYSALAGALNMAIKWGYIQRNPLDLVSLPKQEINKDLVVISESDIKTILEYFKDSYYYMPILLGFTTGMRAGEVCGLTWDCVNFKNKSISIVKTLQLQEKEWVYSTPKTKSSFRNIMMNDKLLEELKRHKVKQAENKLRLGHKLDLNSVNTKENGEIITLNHIRYLNRIVKQKLGIDFKFHYLRHTHATMLLESDIHPKIVQERLGHSKISITLDTYSHISINMQERAMDIFDKKIREKTDF